MLPIPVVGAVVGGGLLLLLFFWWLSTARGRSRVTWHAGRWRRPLGKAFELLFWKGTRYDDMHLLSFPNILVSKATVESRVIARALTRLSAKHPLLKASHLYENGQHYFQEMDSFAVPLIISQESDWERIVETDLLSHYPRNNGPLWRVAYLPNVTRPDITDAEFPHQFMLIFAFHHSIVDGTTAMYLMEDVVKYLEEAEQGTESYEQGLPVPLAADDLLPQMKVTWWDTIISSFISWIGTLGKVKNQPEEEEDTRPNIWLEKVGAEIWRNPHCDVKTCVIPMVLGRDVTARLVSKCRKMKATVTGALQTINCIAITAMAQGGEVTGDFDVAYGTTISMSKLHPQHFPVRSVAAYMSFKESSLQLTRQWKRHFWDLAQRCTESLHRDISSDGIEVMKRIRLAAAVNPSQSSFSTSFEESTTSLGRYRSLVTMSNLGDISYINRGAGNVRVRANFCGNSEHRYGPIFFSHVTTIDGYLSWTINYYPNITERRVAEEFSRKVQDLLKMVIGE